MIECKAFIVFTRHGNERFGFPFQRLRISGNKRVVIIVNVLLVMFYFIRRVTVLCPLRSVFRIRFREHRR